MNHIKCESKWRIVVNMAAIFSKWLPNNKVNILSKVFIYHGIKVCSSEMSFSAFRDKEVSCDSCKHN